MCSKKFKCIVLFQIKTSKPSQSQYFMNIINDNINNMSYIIYRVRHNADKHSCLLNRDDVLFGGNSAIYKAHICVSRRLGIRLFTRIP